VPATPALHADVATPLTMPSVAPSDLCLWRAAGKAGRPSAAWTALLLLHYMPRALRRTAILYQLLRCLSPSAYLLLTKLPALGAAHSAQADGKRRAANVARLRAGAQGGVWLDAAWTAALRQTSSLDI